VTRVTGLKVYGNVTRYESIALAASGWFFKSWHACAKNFKSKIFKSRDVWWVENL